MKTIIPNTMTPAGRPCSASGVILIAFAFSSLALTQRIQAVSPAPDGGYPGGNTAEGQSALLSLTTGGFNTAVGFLSLRSDSTTGFNTAIGAGTLLANTADQNTATGAGALLSNTTASGNTAYGAFALFSNTTGGTLENIQGFDVGPNVAVGSQALESNTTISANTAVGYQALRSYTTGFMDSDLGANTAVGFEALGNATGGYGNCGFGYRTLHDNTDGYGNAAVGFNALSNTTTGGVNIAGGFYALFTNTTGFNNTAYGEEALFNSTGNSNTALGSSALRSLTAGTQNTAVGASAGSNVTSADQVICIGTNGANVSNSCFIGNIREVTTAENDAIPVVIDGAGQLGTFSSSRRFKKEIKPMDKASESILGLNPVTFHYKADAKGAPQFGLIAEEVAEVNPDLVVRDKNGEIYTVRYDAVNAMLLNEFLKEHKKVQQLEAASAQQRNDFEATIVELRKEIAGVVARSRDQDDKIQKVSAQVELNKVVSRAVAEK